MVPRWIQCDSWIADFRRACQDNDGTGLAGGGCYRSSRASSSDIVSALMITRSEPLQFPNYWV